MTFLKIQEQKLRLMIPLFFKSTNADCDLSPLASLDTSPTHIEAM